MATTAKSKKAAAALVSDKLSANLKRGEILSESAYYKVHEVLSSGDVILETDSGQKVRLDSKYVDTFLSSASQFKTTEKLSRTALAELIVANTRVAMTINYNKKVDKEDVIKNIQEVYATSTPKEINEKIALVVDKALEGEERTIVGRHYAHFDAGGRIKFTDMHAPNDPTKSYDTRIRLVDPRTLNWAIFNGVKYIVK